MANDPNQLASNSSRDLAFKVLGGFVLISVFDPIIFEIIHEQFKDSQDSQVFIYRLFNIFYGVFPLLILIAVWTFDTAPLYPLEQKLKRLLELASLFVLILSIALFYNWFSFSLFVPLIGLVLFVLALLRHYYKKGNSHIKKAIKLQAGLIGLLIIILFTFGQRISKDAFNTNYYHESFHEYFNLQSHKREQNELKDKLLIDRYQKPEKGGEVNPKIESIKRKGLELQYYTKVTVDKFYPLFKAIRVNEFYICSIVFILLIWLMSYSKFRGASEKFHHSIKVGVWVYALLIFNLMQTVSVKHITAEKDGFMYYIGNWYVPNAISNVTNNINNYDNRTSYGGAVTNNNGGQGLDPILETCITVVQLDSTLIDSLKVYILGKKLQINYGPNNFYPESIITGTPPEFYETLICTLEEIRSDLGYLTQTVEDIDSVIKATGSTREQVRNLFENEYNEP